MPQPIQPRFTDLSVFEAYLRSSGNSVPKQTVMPLTLAAAERMVERYCRRRFAPIPPLDSTYTRQVISMAGSASSLTPQVIGSLPLGFNGAETPPLQLPLDAATAQAALAALPTVGVGNVVVTGGPLPAWPLSVVWQGTLTGEQPLIVPDSSLLAGGEAFVMDMGYDSRPPVLRRFTTEGRSTIRVPDLRAVDPAPDPRVPNSGGLVLAGRRLLPTQYNLGYGAYAAGGADEAIGSDIAEPATEIFLGSAYGPAFSIAASFSFVAPIGYYSNDLSITGRWGWNPVPEDIVDAVYVVGARRWAERNAFYSDAYVTPEGMTLQFFKQLPAAAQAALTSYRVPNIALVGR